MDPETLRRINLIEALADDHPGCAAPPDDAAQKWTEEQIRRHYTEGCGPTPPEVRANQLAATVHNYRRQAIADGLPFRPNGLFPPGDALLAELGAQARTHAFEKHLAGRGAPAELLPRGSWASGNAGALAGLDLRLFYQERQPDKEWGVVMGAARLGEGASIGNGFWMTAHGGAVETLLDEATAELGKLEFSPMLATIEIGFRIVKAVPLHATLRLDCEIERIRGMRCWVKGAVRDAAGALLATCDAQLADLQQLWRLQT